MKRLLFLALLVFGALHADVIETYDFAEVLTIADENTLVVCDIDNTLIRPTQYLGTTRWMWGYVSKLEGLGLSRPNALAEAERLMKRVLLCSYTELVEERAPSVIAHLQEQGSAVMGYTNRPPSCAFVTNDALAAHEIYLNLTAPKLPKGVLEELEGDYIEGLLVPNEPGEKTRVLAAMLQHLSYDRIVIVDDRYKSLQKALWALEDLEVPVTGVYYRAGERWYNDYDPALTEIQLTHFGHIMSDADALTLLASHVSR